MKINMGWISNLGIIIKIKDVINFFKFRHQMRQLKINDSQFNKLNLNHNWLGNIVYTQINCTDEEIAEYNYSPIDAVINKMKDHVNYLIDIGWGEYLTPEVINFIDDNGNNTLSYLILFVYTPIKFSLTRFVKMIIGLSVLCIGSYLIYKNFFI